MSNKVIAITEKVPKVTTIPDGLYIGKWGGYVIEVKSKDKAFELQTEEGVRGIDINVVVTVKDGVATFETVNS